MEEAFNAAVAVINFIKINSINGRLFGQLCEEEDSKTLLFHAEDGLPKVTA